MGRRLCLWFLVVENHYFLWQKHANRRKTVAELLGYFGAMKSAVFVNYQGLKVKEADELRRSADKEKVAYTVAKKTLLTKALKAAGILYMP